MPMGRCDWSSSSASVADLVSVRRPACLRCHFWQREAARRHSDTCSNIRPPRAIASHVDSLKHRCECTRVTFNGMVHRRNWNLSRLPLATLSDAASAGDIFSSTFPSRRLTRRKEFRLADDSHNRGRETQNGSAFCTARHASAMLCAKLSYCSAWQYFLISLLRFEIVLRRAAPRWLRRSLCTAGSTKHGRLCDHLADLAHDQRPLDLEATLDIRTKKKTKTWF